MSLAPSFDKPLLADPSVPDWANTTLPDTWPDRLQLSRPRDLWRFIRHVLGRQRTPVQLPEGTPFAERIPKYILQEFHNLPNGNYSRRFTRGYITGFNRAMLGEMAATHRAIAQRFAGLTSVLDAGCGGGGLAGALKAAGVADVWGIDPSPYLLQHAAADWPGVHFVQGVAEDTGFAAARFDAVAACFLFHEMPPRYLEQAVAEFARILKPGGWLAVCEPSPLQMQANGWQLLRTHGWRGVYFWLLAQFVHEPFVAAWHRQDVGALFARHGLRLEEDHTGMPMRHILARKA